MVKNFFSVVAAWSTGASLVEINIPWDSELGDFDFGDAVDTEARKYLWNDGEMDEYEDDLDDLIEEIGEPDGDTSAVRTRVPDDIEINEEWPDCVLYTYNKMIFAATKSGTVYYGEDTPGDQEWARAHARVNLT